MANRMGNATPGWLEQRIGTTRRRRHLAVQRYGHATRRDDAGTLTPALRRAKTVAPLATSDVHRPGGWQDLGAEHMEIESKLLVNKTIAAGLKTNPDHVAECLREAEATMNMVALKRGRMVNGTPRLHDVRDSALSKDCVELTFRAPTRAI